MSFLYFGFLCLKLFFISLCNLFIIRFTIILFRDGINQILVWISSNLMVVLVPFKGR